MCYLNKQNKTKHYKLYRKREKFKIEAIKGYIKRLDDYLIYLYKSIKLLFND